MASINDHNELRPIGSTKDAEVENQRLNSINFGEISAALKRNRTGLAGAVAFGLIAALGITALTRPQYTATASVQIDQQAAKVLSTESVEPETSIADADRFLNTQVDVLKSRALATRVSTALGLERNDVFVRTMGEKPKITTASNADGRKLISNQVQRILRDNATINLPRNSRVVSISYRSPSAKLSAQIANMFTQQYIVSNLERKFDATTYARNFLESRLADVRRRLEKSERDLNDYAKGANIIDASNAATPSSTTGAESGGPRSLTVAQLVQLNGAIVTAKTVRSEAEERWRQAQRTPLMSIPEVLGNSAIQELVGQRAQLAAAYEEEKQRRTAEYPTMVQEAARISSLDRQIRQLAVASRNSIEHAYLTAAEQEEALSGDLKSLEARTRSEQDRTVRFNILRREVDTNRQLYDGLLQRYKELSAEAGVTSNNVSVVDRAEVPDKATSPRLGINLAAGLLAGLMVGAVLMFTREKLDDRIRVPDDVPGKLNLPLLGVIPALLGETPREALDDPKSSMSEAYQALRATLELATSHGVPRSLLITSSRPSEGKSTVSYAIARSFALQGRKVLLLDADLRRPSLHKILEAPNEVGVSDLLVERASLVEAAWKTNTTNLSFVPSGRIPPNPVDLLRPDAIGALLRSAQEIYDIIIFDGPPVLGLADVLELSSVAEGTVFVVESGAMHFGGVRASLRRIRTARPNLLGVVLNKFSLKAVGYSADYSYSYTYKYGSSGQA